MCNHDFPLSRPTVNQSYLNSSVELNFQIIDSYVEWLWKKEKHTIYLFGVNEVGNSVAAIIHGFCPYFYMTPIPEVPLPFAVQMLHRRLYDAIPSKKQWLHLKKHCYIKHVQSCMKRDITSGALGQSIYLWKVTLYRKDHIPLLRDALLNVNTYESNLDFILRFFIDHDLGGCRWVTLPRRKYKCICRQADKTTTRQLEVHVKHGDLIPRPVEGQWITRSPVRIACFDIETVTLDPLASEARIIQIATHYTILGEENPYHRSLHGIGRMNPIHESNDKLSSSPFLPTCHGEWDDVRKIDSLHLDDAETSLIQTWLEEIEESDADVISVSCCIFSSFAPKTHQDRTFLSCSCTWHNSLHCCPLYNQCRCSLYRLHLFHSIRHNTHIDL
jgi:DNA polymerase elongation subunit (family B)